MENIITHTVNVLREGGVILYPTDTIWGIGCDARNAAAVEKIYRIKERDHSKSMLVLVGSGKWEIVGCERPTTFIMPHSVWHDDMHLNIADNLPAADGTLGIRIPNHAFCQEVIRQLGAPLVSTSANFSGRPSPQRYEEIEEELKRRMDYCVPPLPAFLSAETRSSRIVKLNPDGTETIIRP
ncbi:MAG: Sua5/YciO/YrdC/YwlC family protein [Bacteroidales bacterium]|nr:Sua5/YciO/YrdC/YwlC family protein [Bacteroidales bacterium]